MDARANRESSGPFLTVLADIDQDWRGAEDVYKKGLERMPDSKLLRANLAWALIQGNQVDEAWKELERTELDPVGLALARSAIELQRSNFAAATLYLADALDDDLELPDITYFDDFLRLLRMSKKLGYAEALIEWFQQTGEDQRRRPIYEGFIAFVRGKLHLRDVNPEVRPSAEKIHDWLTRNILHARELR